MQSPPIPFAKSMSLTQIDPKDVFFTFSRLRPKFSCGRRVEDTLNAIRNNTLRVQDLPPINILVDPKTEHMFSLNNRRLYVFKALQEAGNLDTVPARIKTVPQTKRMKDKYSADKCVKVARLMPEREAAEEPGSGKPGQSIQTDSDGEEK